MGKKQTFQSNGFLNYFGWSRNSYSSQNMEKWIPIVRKKYGKTQTFQINGLLKYFGWSRNPYSSQNMGKVNLHSTGKVRENTEISHSLRYLADLALMRTHEFPMFVNVQIPIKWKYSVESHIIPRLWVFEEIRSYYKTQIIRRVWVM